SVPPFILLSGRWGRVELLLALIQSLLWHHGHIDVGLCSFGEELVLVMGPFTRKLTLTVRLCPFCFDIGCSPLSVLFWHWLFASARPLSVALAGSLCKFVCYAKLGSLPFGQDVDPS